jgi:PEP-CTERM motif
MVRHHRKLAAKIVTGLGLVLAGALLLITPGQAQADIILTVVNAGTPSGSNFLYTYDVMLTPGSTVHAAGGGTNSGIAGIPSQNFFTLYDIPGFVAGSVVYGGALAAAGNSSFSTQNTGITASTEIPKPPDDPNVVNITTYWIGPDVAASGMMAIDLGTLSFLSTNPLGPTAMMLAFTGASQKVENFPALVANNTGQVAGPGPAVSPIPEPGTLALLAVGLPVLGGFYYRRRDE